MCLILFAWQAHPRYALVVAANRDEFHQRPTAGAGFWADDPGLLAGRDTQAGGTWLGMTRAGRFAAITNYREALAPQITLEQSRGHLVRDFLLDKTAALAHAKALAGQGAAYRGFNLLLASPNELAYVSNRSAGPEAVSEGVHGLSNHLLNTDWPKVHAGRERLCELLENDRVEHESLFELLTDRKLTPGELPANIEDSLVREQLMNHYFIVSPDYGTRSSTVVLLGHDGEVEFVERQFNPDGKETETRQFTFSIK
jgi:uncharacterized protein with NRDE domain